MASGSNGTSGGIGFTGLITIAFVVLKLTHAIDWSWWWVLSPLWIATILVVVLSFGLALASEIKRVR